MNQENVCTMTNRKDRLHFLGVGEPTMKELASALLRSQRVSPKTKYFFFPDSKGGKFQKPGKTYVDFVFYWL